LPHVADATMAEAYALKEGLILAQQIGCQNIITQTDCLQVVENWKRCKMEAFGNFGSDFLLMQYFDL
jgi:ribonuclease HI